MSLICHKHTHLHTHTDINKIKYIGALHRPAACGMPRIANICFFVQFDFGCAEFSLLLCNEYLPRHASSTVYVGVAHSWDQVLRDVDLICVWKNSFCLPFEKRHQQQQQQQRHRQRNSPNKSSSECESGHWLPVLFLLYPVRMVCWLRKGIMDLCRQKSILVSIHLKRL